MLVHLTPWKKTTTSLRFTKKSKRRRDDGNEGRDFPAVASFVTTSTKKGQQKLKHHSSEFSDSSPILTVTSSHSISVLGRTRDHSVDEFASLRYSGRPGSAGSFFPSSEEKKGSSDLPQIPAILDAKNDMVYAMQLGNTRLCCWNALESTGPNDKNSLKAHLSHPALSMSLLPMHKGIAYGTCEDGSLFIARVIDASGGEPTISVEYIQSTQVSGSRHVGTFAELPQAQNKPAGRKRKVSDADGLSPVVFYQLSCTSVGTQLVRHDVLCDRLESNANLVVMGSHSQQTASIDLIPASEVGKKTLGKVEILVSSMGTSPKVAILYRICDVAESSSKSRASSKTWCSLLSLSLGDISHKPVPLPSTATQFGLLTDTIVATASSTLVCLYDLETGGKLYTVDITGGVHASSENWLLCTDVKFGTLAILYVDADAISSVFATLSSDQHHRVAQNEESSLASKIATTISNSVVADTGRSGAYVNSLLDVGASNGVSASREDIVRRAVLSLETTQTRILSDGSDLKTNKLLEAYEKSVASVLAEFKGCYSGSLPGHNPQEALPSNTNGFKNGKKSHGDKATPDKIANGVKSPISKQALTSKPELPQDFIDGCLRVIISVLCSESMENQNLNARKDALVILRRLIQTGKVSARVHFEDCVANTAGDENPLNSILRSVEACNKSGVRSYSSVDLILDVLKRCPDVSERQLVVMLNYVICRASPVDIAEMMAQSRRHPLKAKCKSYASLHRKRQKLKKTDGTDEAMTNTIVLTGATRVLYEILGYSECNEAMLKIALLEEVGAGQEPIIVARLLSSILSARIHHTSTERSVVRSICQWVSALCDAFHETLRLTKAPSGGTYMDILVRSTEVALRQTRAIVALLDEVDNAELQTETSQGPGPSEIPGYSVDHLVF
eukprot:CAMPEP_0116996424 /NCGR_PEP_ID=MMETSP0472-20121206/228_1 /TAXON_ID=693140 ORGANISM="Tiarina fusus, Strain LIS" /NCGR_SAMPLE_ID=MMETSP0472 /ASSEMBLY_ACC=CAM_ASM_000603 /LENGTH=904 /DNA_ID=CAMNT_0004695027 /DNA_START=115 /DNA_END=2829 /DNA_ORIENTATION=-